MIDVLYRCSYCARGLYQPAWRNAAHERCPICGTGRLIAVSPAERDEYERMANAQEPGLD